MQIIQDELATLKKETIKACEDMGIYVDVDCISVLRIEGAEDHVSHEVHIEKYSIDEQILREHILRHLGNKGLVNFPNTEIIID